MNPEESKIYVDIISDPLTSPGKDSGDASSVWSALSKKPSSSSLPMPTKTFISYKTSSTLLKIFLIFFTHLTNLDVRILM